MKEILKSIISDMAPDEIRNLIRELEKELISMSEFDMEFELSSSKAAFPASYKTIQYIENLAKKTDSEISVSTSQLLKRLETDEASKLIEAMKEGKRIQMI